MMQIYFALFEAILAAVGLGITLKFSELSDKM